MIFHLLNLDVINENHLDIINKIFFVIGIMVIYKNILPMNSSDLCILE